MNIRLYLAIAIVLLTSSPTLAQFSGDFELGPSGCKTTRNCKLTFDLKYRDPRGVEWLAAANDQTDGATIPGWAQPFIGDPFDDSYIKAAVIHDHYCDRHVRTWRETHRAFYDALIELGMSTGKAKLMYYAVYLAGPKWVEVIPGKLCGRNCVFKLDTGSGSSQVQTSNIVARAAVYDEPGFDADMKDVENVIAQYGEKADLAYLERRAEKKNPTDYFYNSGRQVSLGRGGELQ